jgi:biopolymer transport protein ExbD
MSMNTNNGGEQDDIVSDINMTPLIDIMLVLLIIFMVSSSAAIESGLDVNLPDTHAVSDKTDAILVISLTKTGDLAVQGNKVTMEQLHDVVVQELAKLKTDSVILEGDEQANLSAVMTIMDTARNAGAKNFSIAAKLTKEGK